MQNETHENFPKIKFRHLTLTLTPVAEQIDLPGIMRCMPSPVPEGEYAFPEITKSGSQPTPEVVTRPENEEMRAMFTRLRFSEDAAAAIVNEQNVDSIDELKSLSIKECASLCDLIRQKMGTPVSLIAENNLKLAVYYAKHQDRISRVCNIESIDRNAIRDVRDLRDAELTHCDPEMTFNFALQKKPKDWAKALDAVRDFLAENLGVTGVPLSYVVRAERDVQPESDDPPTNYGSQIDEMVARAPHVDANGRRLGSFNQDNRRVWDIMKYIFRDTDHWVHIQDCQNRHDGRRAFQSLWDRFVQPGNSNVSLANRAVKSFTAKELVQLVQSRIKEEDEDTRSVSSRRSTRSTQSYLDRFKNKRAKKINARFHTPLPTLSQSTTLSRDDEEEGRSQRSSQTSQSYLDRHGENLSTDGQKTMKRTHSLLDDIAERDSFPLGEDASVSVQPYPDDDVSEQSFEESCCLCFTCGSY